MKTYIIQSKDNGLIKKSSSGGMFAEIARYVLSRGGVVFGCAMQRADEGFEVKHIYIENENDLYKLQGSKYVQSNLGNTINQAKEFLDCGRLVLFSGTPCQIAGLKAFLKQDYKNLITVDLSCEGTPPLKIFNDYIAYLEKNVIKAKIIDFKFRSKKYFGWSTSGFVASYKDKNKIQEKVLPQNLSSYFTFFLRGDILQERCFGCKYTGINRIGDITIADAWGIENEYPELLKNKFNRNKGISLILINSQKGRKIFETIKTNLVTNDVDIKRLRKYNHPLRHPSQKSLFREKVLDEYNKYGYEGIERTFRKNLGKMYYYYILKNHTPKFIKKFIKLFMYNNIRTDCLLMTLYCLCNYGSLLTAYALYKTVTNLGYASKLIHYGNITGYGKKFIEKYLPLTSRVLNSADFVKLNKLSDTFILGSDNLINLETNPFALMAQNLLNFTEDNKKRIMISGSIGGWDGSTKDKSEHDYIKFLLERFDYVSTREEHGKDVFENVFNVKSDWINDPVFYLEKENYVELTKDVQTDYSDKIMQYILYPTNKTDEVIDFYKKNLGADVEKFDGNENVKYFSRHNNKSVENWLAAIINSKLIITDSFHCVAFCLIFNRSFVCIKNTHATVRFTSLFKRLGINIPLIESVEDLDGLNLDYDKQQVNKSLQDIREFALNKIEKILLKPKQVPKNSDDTMKIFNKEFIKNSTAWYKKNKLFYFGIIVPFVVPVKRLLADIKR